MIRMDLKATLRNWMPPAIWELLSKITHKSIEFKGTYNDWMVAENQCTGYSQNNILTTALSSALKVKRGEAIFERDSVLFDEIEYSWPVTAALMWAAAQNMGYLHVIDFGGALASSYYQNVKFINKIKGVKWSVIEQSHFVEAGKKHIADDIVKFYDDASVCMENGKSNVLLLSSVLQYIQSPYKLLDSLIGLDPVVIIIDRTPFINKDTVRDVIKIQQVPDAVYTASYPCWFFSKTLIVQHIEKSGYRLVETFASISGPSKLATWQGMIFIKEN